MPDAATPRPLVYACIDVEASGPYPNPFNLVSVGAVPVLQSGSGTWEVDPARLHYVEIKPMYPGFDPGAMAIHGLSREHLDQEGLPPRTAMGKIAEWVASLPGRPVFAGHNAVFDWAFINHYFLACRLDNPFGWKGLDSKSLAAGVLGIPFPETSKENLARLLPGLGAEDMGLKHRADYDALYQGRILAALLNHPRRA